MRFVIFCSFDAYFKILNGKSAHTIHNSQFAKNNNSTCQKRRTTQIVWHNTPAAFSIWPINGWQNFLLFCLFADLLFFFLQGGRMSETNLHVGKRMYQYLWLSFSQIQIKPAWYQTEQYSNSSSSIYSVLFLCVRNFFLHFCRVCSIRTDMDIGYMCMLHKIWPHQLTWWWWLREIYIFPATLWQIKSAILRAHIHWNWDFNDKIIEVYGRCFSNRFGFSSEKQFRKWMASTVL